MSLLIPAAMMMGSWVYVSHAMDKINAAKAHAQITKLQDDGEDEWLIDGHYRPFSSVSQSSDIYRGTFKSLEETIDERGVKIFLVDYGNGARVIQYYDPRIIL
jgi:hypothetical protein